MDKLKPNSKKSKLIKKIVIIILILLSVLGCTYIGLRIWFKSEINRICDSAMSQYQGDKIQALISVLNSETESLNDKNRVIWALGKLRDKRSLPVLKKDNRL